jgi:hypothetical protein
MVSFRIQGDRNKRTVPKRQNKGLPCMHFFFIIDKWLFSPYFQAIHAEGLDKGESSNMLTDTL